MTKLILIIGALVLCACAEDRVGRVTAYGDGTCRGSVLSRNPNHSTQITKAEHNGKVVCSVEFTKGVAR